MHAEIEVAAGEYGGERGSHGEDVEGGGQHGQVVGKAGGRRTHDAHSYVWLH